MFNSKIVKCTYRLLQSTKYDVEPIISNNSEVLSVIEVFKSPVFRDPLFSFYMYRKDAENPDFMAVQIRAKILSLPSIDYKEYDLNNLQG